MASALTDAAGIAVLLVDDDDGGAARGAPITTGWPCASRVPRESVRRGLCVGRHRCHRRRHRHGRARRGAGRAGRRGGARSPCGRCRYEPPRARPDLAADLAIPQADSTVRILLAGERARLFDDLLDAVGAHDGESLEREVRVLDPDALRRDGISLVAPPPASIFDPGRTQPGPTGPIWTPFPWALPDDQSYRDYLRSVFVLFAHQQKWGVGADPQTLPRASSSASSQRASSRTSGPPTAPRCPSTGSSCRIVTAILTAPTGSGLRVRPRGGQRCRHRARSPTGSTWTRCWRSRRSRSRSSRTGTGCPSREPDSATLHAGAAQHLHALEGAQRHRARTGGARRERHRAAAAGRARASRSSGRKWWARRRSSCASTSGSPGSSPSSPRTCSRFAPR